MTTWGSRERAGRSGARVIYPVVLVGALIAVLFTVSISAVPAETTITLTSLHLEQAGDANTRQLLSYLDGRDVEAGDVSRRLVALPECDIAIVNSVSLAGLPLSPDEAARLAWVEDIVHIRDQAVAVVAIDAGALALEQARLSRLGEIEIVVVAEDASGPVSRNAGPFTGVCDRAILNYDASGDASPVWVPPSKYTPPSLAVLTPS